MAVNQAQVDHIISTASADDPEVKLLKLQDEVELLKTSIKRLLIDIRERMNDMENPFNVGMQGGSVPDAPTKSIKINRQDPVETIEIEEVHAQKPEHVPPANIPPNTPPNQDAGTITRIPLNTGNPDEMMLAAIRAQFAGMPGQAVPAPKESESAGKVRLQKVFRLFEWTSKTVKKYGHDRVDLMLESYRAMGYISDESAKLVRDITRLMPTTLGEIHEIRADEFVSELYELNHILNPSDATLDRDMIEVLMEKRGTPVTSPGVAREDHSREEQPEADFIHSKDRI